MYVMSYFVIGILAAIFFVFQMRRSKELYTEDEIALIIIAALVAWPITIVIFYATIALPVLRKWINQQ